MIKKDTNEIYHHLSTIHSLIGAAVSVIYSKEYIEIMFNEKTPDEIKSNACKLEMKLCVAYNLIQESEKSMDKITEKKQEVLNDNH